MIGLTKIICGQATIAEALNYGRDTSKLPAHMLQFSDSDRPLVVWNTTNRCNLRCQHCYINAADHEYSGELTNEEARAMIDDLAEMKCPVLLFSGGEPLMRKDVFELAAYARDKGIRPVLSTNGTLITPEVAQKIKDAGLVYAGVSIDGGPATHDHFRQKKGSFDKAIEGIRNCAALGIKAGVRLTVNKQNYKDLPEVLDIVEREKIPRFCMYHLVYAGRGTEIVEMDLSHEQTRDVIHMLIEKVIDWKERGVETEVLTTDNHADGILLAQWLAENQPEQLEEAQQLFQMHGGCSAGRKFANVDPTGEVHPCQFWSHVTLGNVRERKFSEIWNNPENELLQKLKRMPEPIDSPRCGKCNHKQVCGGCRIRAEVVNGDVWGDDPACFLTDEEIFTKGKLQPTT